MSYQVSREHQEKLLAFVADATDTFGWKPDAVAFSVARKDSAGVPGPIQAVGVFENFTGPGRAADFSFAMVPGYHITKGIIDAFLFIAFHNRLLGIDRLWMQAKAENLISQRCILGLGAQFQFRKQGSASDGSDVIVFLLNRPVGTRPPAKAPDDANSEKD